MLLVLIIILKTVEPHLYIQPLKSVTYQEESHLNAHMQKCITSISDRYFEAGSTVVISVPCDSASSRIESSQGISPSEPNTRQHINSQNINTYEATLLLRQLHGKLKWSVVTLEGSGGQYQYHKWYNHILFASHTVSKQLEFLRSFGQAWNPRGRFIVVLNNIYTNPQEQARVVLKELRDEKILNAIILVPAARGYHTLDIYSWFPHQSPTGKCGQIGTVILLDQWMMRETGYFTRNVSLFPRKIPRDLRQCPLTVSTFPFPPFTIPGYKKNTYDGGFEIRLLEFIAGSMNMSIVYTAPTLKEWGKKLKNGSWTGVSGDIQLDRADIGLAALMLGDDEAVDLEFTVCHGSLGFHWVVPCAKPFPRWKSITRVYSLAAWFSILITIVFAAIVLMCLVRYSDQEMVLYKSLTGGLLCIWAVILGISAGSGPVSGHVRSFFIFWIWYSIAINTLFQAFVTTCLVDPGLQKQIQSLHDILESGVEYGFFPNLKGRFLDESDELLIKIVQQSQPCHNVEACTQRVAKRGDFVTLSNNVRLQYLNTYSTLDENGKPLLCTFGDNVILNFKTLYVPRGSPVLHEFNRAISAALQAGLVEYWWESELVASRIKAASIRKNSPLDNYSVLVLKHLQSAFYLLFLGYCLASLAFIGEFFCSSTFCHSKSRNLKFNRRLIIASGEDNVSKPVK